jgi:hypothetical protein
MRSISLLLSYQQVIFIIKIACPYKLLVITKIGFHLEIISFHLETDFTFKETFWTGLIPLPAGD